LYLLTIFKEKIVGEIVMQIKQKFIFLAISLLLLSLIPSCIESERQVDTISRTGSAVRIGSSTAFGPDFDYVAQLGEANLRKGSAEASKGIEQQNRQDMISKRFPGPTIQGRTVVESAIELTEKYAKISEEALALRERNKNLVDENNNLKEQSSRLEADLKKTQKELAEANDLLIEMQVELNNWKMDVLGFRNEIRQAETAQLEALLKILRVLGGEVTAESASSEKKS
jgi:hypothetical protein